MSQDKFIEDAPVKISAKFRAVLKGMLNMDRKLRWTAEEIL